MTVLKEGDFKGEKIVTTLDDAMLISGFGVYNILQMLLGGLILMGVITQTLAMGLILPAAHCDLQLTTQLQGMLGAIPFLAIILTSFFWGYLGDTRGRKPVMLYTMIPSLVVTVLASFAPNTISFAVLVFIAATFTSGSTAVVYTYIGEFNNNRHRDKMVAFGSSFVGIGTVVLPAISWLILPNEFSKYIPFLDIYYRPWRLLVVACAIPFFFGCILLYFTPESPKFMYEAGRYEETLEVLKTMYTVNKRMPSETFPVKGFLEPAIKIEQAPKLNSFMGVLKSIRDQTAPLFKMPLVPWTCIVCFVQFGMFAASNGFYVWFPTILNSLSVHEGETKKICTILAEQRLQAAGNGTEIECNDKISTQTFEMSIYIGLVFCSMYIMVGFLVDYVGKRKILVVVLTVTGISGVAAHLINDQHIAVVMFAIFQMAGACIGVMNAVAVELFPTKYRAMAVCLGMMLGRTGSMVGSNLIGYLLTTNCGASFFLFGGLIFVDGLLCLALPTRKTTTTKNPLSSTVESTQSQTHEPA